VENRNSRERAQGTQKETIRNSRKKAQKAQNKKGA